MNASLTGTKITPPPDFPVAWENPQDEQYHWTRDREHFPDPITPMFDSLTAIIAAQGQGRVHAAYDEAIVGRRDICVNTYKYIRLIPFAGAPQETAARAQRNHAKVSAVSQRLGEILENEWKPEIDAIWAWWDSFDLAGADMAALSAHLDETLERGARLYELHYLMGAPMWFALHEFETFYCDLFPGATALDAHRLLQGFDNKTLEIGRALWRLRDLTKAAPPVRAAFELPAPQVCAALQDSEQGRAFLVELRAFLAAYGCRSNLWDWGYPSWEDDPTPVINNIKNYIALPDRDPLAGLRQAAAEREQAIARAREELVGYPQPVIDRFEKLLKAAQAALVLTENHTFYIDFNGLGRIRRVIREFGKRLAAQGRLAKTDDVFYLELGELRQMLADAELDYSALAAERRAEAERWAAYQEPLELGTRPAEPIYLYSPDARRMLRYVGGLAADAPVPTMEQDILRGQAGSSGQARGPARLILALDDAHRLQPGDILVTATTAPPWTPLFLTASAVVTDAGGLLSHGAVVAREYRIPAVVGARYATTLIRDGQMLEVDGDAGTVRLL